MSWRRHDNSMMLREASRVFKEVSSEPPNRNIKDASLQITSYTFVNSLSSNSCLKVIFSVR
jgi:hypothetical protein